MQKEIQVITVIPHLLRDAVLVCQVQYLEIVYCEGVWELDFDFEAQVFEDIHFRCEESVVVYLSGLSEETRERLPQDGEEDIDYILWVAGCFKEFRG